MKKYFINAVFVIFISACLYSCSEETTKPPDNNDNSNKYFPLSIGSWWTYTNYQLDEEGNKVTSTEIALKYVIGSKETFENKEAFVFNIQDLLGNKIDNPKIYFATKTQIFEFTKLMPDLDFSLPIDVPVTWYKIADDNANSWILFTQDLDKVDFQFGAFTITLDDLFEIKVENKGFEDVRYGENLEKTVQARKYVISYTFGGNAFIAGVIPIQIPFNFESTNYYAPNIGLVKNVMTPLVITLQGTEYFRMEGTEQILMEYHIAD